jgi:molecular chaperone DnaJ
MTSADWANNDFYKVLGVAKDASAADIKKAYRKLARANHPDSHPGDQAAEERFKAIAEAYDVVGDTEKRKQYDELRSGLGGFGPYTTGGAGTPPFDFNDVFSGGGTRTGSGGGGFSDLSAGGSTGTGDSDEDVVDAEIVDEDNESEGGNK